MTDIHNSSNIHEFTTRYGALDGAKQNIVRNLLWVISEKTGQGLCMCVHNAMCCVETHILPLLALLSSSVHISNIADADADTNKTEPTKKQYTFSWTLGDFFVPEFIIQESNAQWDQWASLMSLEGDEEESE